MRRHHVVLLTLLSFATIVSAQAPAPPPLVVNGGLSVIAHGNADLVVARILSFDRDRDGRVAKGELPERMQNLVALGDAGRDGTLDATEIRKLATTPSAPATGRGFPTPGGYTFGDQVGLSSRAHIEGALEDLRLPASTRDRALAVVRTFVDTLESNASANLLKEMESLLTAEQLASFKDAIDFQSAGPLFTVTQSHMVAMRPDLERLMNQSGLTPEHRRQAFEALGRFSAQLGDPERSAMLQQMKGILSGEERDNFRAALERRPLVKSGVVGGVVGGVINVIKPAGLERAIVDGVVVMPPPPPPPPVPID
jgi:hypothetical protein